MDVKSPLAAFLIAIVVSGFSLAGITCFSLAQDSTSFKISGYILDCNGHGVAGAMIIFNVPQIVPAVYSDSSGYYVISAPAGTYHINVWPPFDSNYIYYDETGFVVGSDITKNITLTSGYKVSGYITDASGTPIVKAVVSLNNYLCGWYSTYTGYYFVTAPAGTYTLSARPASGPQDVSNFSPYYEYNVVVNGNLAKNITVDGTSPTPSPAPSPAPAPAPEPSPSPTGSVITSDPNSWPMFHNDLAHSGYSVSTGPLTNQTLWKYQTGSSVESSPAVVGGIVYFGALWNGNNGFVYALNATTGLKIWQFATDSGVESSPAVVGGVVYIGSYGGRVYALNAADGSLIWSFNAGGSVFPSPAVVDGKVYVGSASGNLYALNAADGSPLWSYHTGGAIFSSPAVVDGVVYFGSQDQNVYALRASDGHQIWHYTTGSYVDTSPAVVGGMVYFGSRDGYVYALNATNGSKIWSFHSPRWSINRRTYYYSTPAVANGVVYFGMYDSYIYALSAANGGLIWEFPTRGYVFSSPVVASGVVYVGSFDGNVYALDAITGGKIWSYQTGSEMRSSAAVASGVVYVGSGDGYLYAFGSSGAQPTPARTQISISTDAPSSVVGSAVNVNGRLSFVNGSALKGETVILSYAVGNSASWIPIGSAITNDAGEYNIQWINYASGTFTLKVAWTENANYQETSNTTTLSFLPYDGQNFFHVESNSTVSALAFNSTTSELSFTVSGPNGTSGYVKATIAKSLISNAENVKVYLDGKQLNYEVTSNADSWLLSFTYTHSTHQVSINLATNNSGNALLGMEYCTWIVVAISVVVICISLLVYFKKRTP